MKAREDFGFLIGLASRTALMVTLFLFTGPMLYAAGDETSASRVLLHELEEALERRGEYAAKKEHRIDSLKSRLHARMSDADRLDIYDKLYNEYLVYNYDSTMSYVNKAGEVASRLGGYDRRAAVEIHRALSLATSGQFSQAVGILRSLDSGALDSKLREEYYVACEWTYGVWADYSEGSAFADEYRGESLLYLDSLINVTRPGSAEYSYRLGERALREHDYALAIKNYTEALDKLPVATRLYAQSAYALGVAYKETGDNDKYRQWLIRAAISDQENPLKENLALQQLAKLITEEDGDVARANRYLEYSLEDAIFFNNRLRMVEIAEKIPGITNVYQQRIAAQNHRMRIYLIVIGILAIGLVVAVWIVARERKRLDKLNKMETDYSRKLSELNHKLAATNKRREQYVSLFMDLCAGYIDKFSKFRQTVSLKLKARQYEELQRLTSGRARPTETELKEVFFNFDSAFLRLYPDFVEDFNRLLRPGEGIYPKSGEMLTPDLRIFAMIRMGITDSTKIATLLFYSPQTIFNRRTQVRNRAIDRETFEEEVRRIG